jgi:hypothetical protein
MKRKNPSVETSFHPILTSFLFEVDEVYIAWGDEAVITSGSEQTAKHSRTSLHYATPAQAADIRIWSKKLHGRGSVPDPAVQHQRLQLLAKDFCANSGFPNSWVEVILEANHIHIEYQPKRILT